MALQSRPSGTLAWHDVVLASSGLIGLLLFLFVGPSAHPHSVAAEHISYQAAIDTARAFTQRSGRLSLRDANADATIQYDGELLNALQDRLGREAAMQAIREDSIPAYRWHVTWTKEASEGTETLGSTDVTLDGRPLGLEITSAAIPRDVVHRQAIAQVFDLAVDADSSAMNRLDFRLETAREAPIGDENASDRTFLDKSDAEKLARYHLRDSHLRSEDLRVDSVFASGSDGLVTATVRVSSVEDAPGRYVSADVEVMPTGTLVNLLPRFTQNVEAEGMGLTSSALREIGTVLLFMLIALLLVIVFFRRINARLIDTKTALQDALVCGIAAALVVSVEVSGIDLDEPLEIVGLLMGMIVLGGAGGIGMFFISGAANSLARERWENKLQSIVLLRNFYIRNVPVGLALLRGVFSGLALVGVGAAMPALFGDLDFQFSGLEDVFYLAPYSGLGMVGSVGEATFGAFFLTFGAVLGIGALLHRKRGTDILAIAAVVLVLAALQISPIDLRPLPLELLISGLYGAALAFVFWRFGALETLISLFVFTLLLPAMPSWSATSTPEFFNAILSLVAVGFLAAVGFVGVVSGKTSSEVPIFIPEYIRELSQQERIKRELELAREVQLSLLPSEMPDMHGLEFATICLPANEVGGDYYDFFQIGEGQLGIVVGDVSGKGMQAAFYMTLMKGILQSLNLRSTNPAEVLAGANEIFRMNAPRGMFMSIILGVIDVKNRTWTCVRAGHNPFLIQRARVERPESIKQKGAAIGLLSSDAFSESLDEITIFMERGDLLLIYTDGITEAMNRKRMLFEEIRLEESLASAKGRSAADVVASIIRDVESFCGDAPRQDDMTMVAVRFVEDDEE